MNMSSTPRQPVPQSSGTSLEDALARITRHPEIAALLKEPGARLICPGPAPGDEPERSDADRKDKP